jgi:Zn-dependent peptidase ImmA (M78 family)
MFPELTRDELAAGLDRVVEEVLAEAGVRHPPVDALSMAQTLGLVIAVDDRQEGRARYVRLADRWAARSRATILLRPEPRFERRQWAVAHEIGEHVAQRVFAQWGADPRETAANAREHVANWLAGRLLLPTRWFAADADACRWDLLTLKCRYRTASHELIARRMLECRPAVVISIFDQQRLSFRRSNVSGRVPPPSRAEIECWNRVHERCHPLQTRQGPSLVQGWPIHEEGWQREILRMEIEDWADCS